MASGLLALLDDVAVIAKAAAASVDDVAAASMQASAKAAGVVVDDAAVTPRYVTGFSPARELPMIWRIARGSLRNKLLLLLPGFLLLAAFAPALLTPLLMLGGAFLCYEAAEKLAEGLGIGHHPHETAMPVVLAPEERESAMVTGAIRTDLILSAEILAIALNALGAMPIAEKAAVLAVVSVAVTAGVYGFVALLVKLDDMGLGLARRDSRTARALGRAMVAAMPRILSLLSVVGIAAMAWVGGGILVHGMEDLGLLPAIPAAFHAWAHAAGALAPAGAAAVEWIANALFAGFFGMAAGSVVALAVSALRRVQPRVAHQQPRR